MRLISSGSKVGFWFGLLLASASGSTLAVNNAPDTIEPSRDYLVGLVKHLVQRGYVTANVAILQTDEIDVYYRSVPTGRDLGSTVDFLAAIPVWSIEMRLRRADYGIVETGARVHNRNLCVSSIGVMRSKLSENGWKAYRTTAKEVYAAAPVAVRPLSVQVKTAILRRIAGPSLEVDDLRNYRFSPLSVFENRLWVYDTVAGKLFDVASDGDLDDLDFIGAHPITSIKSYSSRDTDLSDGTLLRKNPRENIVMLFGLWSCFADK